MSTVENFPGISLVLGGARSGKSAFAERLATFADRPRAYIATGQAFDLEMEARIAQHRLDRGPDWQTIEAPLDILQALKEVNDGSVVLIDCLTLWLSNLMLADANIENEIEILLTGLASAPKPIVFVSNEVGMGLVPDNQLGRRFRDAQGVLNREIAKRADLAVFVAAGLPLLLKGELPEALK